MATQVMHVIIDGKPQIIQVSDRLPPGETAQLPGIIVRDKDGNPSAGVIRVGETFTLVKPVHSTVQYDRLMFMFNTPDAATSIPLVQQPYESDVEMTQLIRPHEVRPQPFQAGDQASGYYLMYLPPNWFSGPHSAEYTFRD